MNLRPETIKLLEESISGNFLDSGLGNYFLDFTLKAKATKAKINKWTTSNQKLLHGKGNHQQNKKETYQMGENICKLYT